MQLACKAHCFPPSQRVISCCCYSKREIPQVNYVMHEVHCHRHIDLCRRCNESISRANADEHHQEVHAEVHARGTANLT
eukprot:m.28446 g.28446  ORF g.28446 m.28446 type:complete len:79 (+) comp30785_c0_seq2:145-381(+)